MSANLSLANVSLGGGTSIRNRLVVSYMLTTVIALIMVSTAIFIFQFVQYRGDLVREGEVLARVMGMNSSASLLFNDSQTAEETLGALAAQKHVMAAVIYDHNDAPFAGYLRNDVTDFEVPDAPRIGNRFFTGRLELTEPILVDGERQGLVFIQMDTGQLTSFTRIFTMIVTGVMLAALGFCYIGATMMRRRIATPIIDLVDGAGRMAEGDLSVQVAVSSDDEIGELARAFNRMTSSLRGLVSQVRENTLAVGGVTTTLTSAGESIRMDAARQEQAVEGTSEAIERIHHSIGDVNSNVETLSGTAMETSAAATQMDVAIGQIAMHMDSLSETIDATASSVVEMTTAIREIAQSADILNGSSESTSGALQLLLGAVKRVEGNARETHELSAKAADQAADGVKSVDETVRGMQEIQTSFEGLEKIILDLSEKSGSIGEIVKVIEGVVEQTNLLALNAAIISSQAGEHGRAFAVVAEEVRNLAERTAGSTREISELITAVQGGVGDAVEAMNRGNERVRNGVTLSRQAGTILRGIGEAAEESARRVDEIVSATEGQTRDIEKVEEQMAQLRTIAEQLNRGTHEQDNASADITRAVEHMRDLGQRIKHSTQEQRKESEHISKSVEVVASRIEQILDSTKEQAKQGDQILQAIQVFREAVGESNHRNKGMQESIRELSERARVLDEEVGRFQI
jgi:methyl-accepting chemotaxis protein